MNYIKKGDVTTIKMTKNSSQNEFWIKRYEFLNFKNFFEFFQIFHRGVLMLNQAHTCNACQTMIITFSLYTSFFKKFFPYGTKNLFFFWRKHVRIATLQLAAPIKAI